MKTKEDVPRGFSLVYTVHVHVLLYAHTLIFADRKVKRSSVTLPVLPPIEAYWSWNERDNNFVVYSIPAVIDIELAYQQAPHSSSRTRSRRSPTVDLSQYPSGIPYAIDFSAMKQTRHGYGTQRAIKRCELPTGISLQSLLQSCPLHSHSPPHSLASSSGSNSFSLACGPATSMLKASVGTGGGVTSATAATAAVSSVAKPTTRKGRGKKRSPSKSSSPSLGRRDKTGGEQTVVCVCVCVCVCQCQCLHESEYVYLCVVHVHVYNTR